MNDMIVDSLNCRLLAEVLRNNTYHCNYCGATYDRPHDCTLEIERMNKEVADSETT